MKSAVHYLWRNRRFVWGALLIGAGWLLVIWLPDPWKDYRALMAPVIILAGVVTLFNA